MKFTEDTEKLLRNSTKLVKEWDYSFVRPGQHIQVTGSGT